jgi:hypothetical protein
MSSYGDLADMRLPPLRPFASTNLLGAVRSSLCGSLCDLGSSIYRSIARWLCPLK